MSDRTADQIMTDERLDSLERRMDDVERWQREAVPNGDAVGHCRYHQLMIDDIEAKKRLRAAVMEKTIAGLVWSFIAAIGWMCWQQLIAIVKSVKGG